jgi:hypothetical protein
MSQVLPDHELAEMAGQARLEVITTTTLDRSTLAFTLLRESASVTRGRQLQLGQLPAGFTGLARTRQYSLSA